MSRQDFMFRLAAALAVLVCAGLIGFGFWWVLQNMMFWLPIHLHVFGVTAFSAGALILVAFGFASLWWVLKIFMGK